MTWAELHPQASNLQCSLNGPVSRGLWLLCCKHGAKKWYPTKKIQKNGEKIQKNDYPTKVYPEHTVKTQTWPNSSLLYGNQGLKGISVSFLCLHIYIHSIQCSIWINGNPMQLHRTCDPAVSIMAGRSIDFLSSTVLVSTPGSNFTYLAATAVRIAVTIAVIIIIAGCSISPIALMSTCGLAFYHS